MLFVHEAVLLPMSNHPNGIVHTARIKVFSRHAWTLDRHYRPGHHQKVSVDCCRIDWGRLGCLEGWLLPSCAAQAYVGLQYVSSQSARVWLSVGSAGH